MYFFEKEVGTPGFCIIVMQTTIFINYSAEYKTKAIMAEPLQDMKKKTLFIMSEDI